MEFVDHVIVIGEVLETCLGRDADAVNATAVGTSTAKAGGSEAVGSWSNSHLSDPGATGRG